MDVAVFLASLALMTGISAVAYAAITRPARKTGRRT